VPTVIVNVGRGALFRAIAIRCPIQDGESVGGADPLAEEIARLEETVARAFARLDQLQTERRHRQGGPVVARVCPAR
jgi:hypothetical protein